MTVIDGFPLLFLPGGIKSYLIALLKALDSSKQLQEIKFVVLLPKVSEKVPAFYHKEIHELEKTLDSRFTFKYVKISPLLFVAYSLIRANEALVRRYTLFLWENYYLPKAVRKISPSVVLHPYQAVSNYKTSARKVVVVHDTFHWDVAQHYSFIEKILYDSYKKGCIQSDIILTISQSSKQEIVEYLKIDEKKKVAVVYEGVDDLFVTFKPGEKEKEDIIKQYNLPKKYIFGLISIRDYKNAIGILESFAILSKTDPELRLVLVGWALGSHSTVSDYIQKIGLEDKIIAIPKVSKHQDLAYLYHLSFAFLFLSYKEGFGLPPLEAVICKTLPIVSNVSAIGEIYTGILPTFDPKDYQGVADYIMNLTTEKRQSAISSAREKLLRMYTWENILPGYLKYLT